MVYTADSLALATLELSVHLAGARVAYSAIEVDIADVDIRELSADELPRRWKSDEAATQRAGEKWTRSLMSLALRVPSVLVDARSGEGNVLINPAHDATARIAEVQRFRVVLDERLR